MGSVGAAKREFARREFIRREFAVRGGSTSRGVVVIDSTGRILYHQNQALAYQLVNDSLPHFKPVAARMMSGDAGWQSFWSGTGDEVWAAFSTFPEMNMSVAILENYKEAMAAARRSGIWGLVYSVLIGSMSAILLSFYLQRRTGDSSASARVWLRLPRANLITASS